MTHTESLNQPTNLIFECTADPIHFGHVSVLAHAASHLRPQNILFIPSPQHAYQSKNNRLTPFAHRHRMTTLALDQLINTLQAQHISVSLYDPDQSTLKPWTKTFDLLSQLDTLDSTVGLLIGSDNLLDFPNWHRWSDILELAHLYVVPRNGLTPDQIKSALPPELISLSDTYTILPAPPAPRRYASNYSSHEIRARFNNPNYLRLRNHLGTIDTTDPALLTQNPDFALIVSFFPELYPQVLAYILINNLYATNAS